MSIWLAVAGLFLFIAVGAAGAAWYFGPERAWRLLGPADLGPVDFETLQRRPRPTDALACPNGLCRIETDILPPLYPVDVPTLRKAMGRALMSERRLTLVDIDDRLPQDRYVQRSEKLRFPDTIVVRYVARAGGATVAIYSRSQLGWNDLGVNHNRVERWLRKLSREVAKMRSGAEAVRQ
jgi:uncharacterized protein (DUF1499 family)